MEQNVKSSIFNLQSVINYWLPPLAWMALIFYFSTDTFSASNTGSLLYRTLTWLFPGISVELYEWLHFLIRKGAHFTEYAILALLWLRAFRAGRRAQWEWRWGIYAFLAVAAYALLDEFHQSFTRRRTGSIYDSLLDISGGVTALLLVWGWRRSRGD